MDTWVWKDGKKTGEPVLPDSPENDNLRGLESGVQARLTGYIRSGGYRLTITLVKPKVN